MHYKPSGKKRHRWLVWVLAVMLGSAHAAAPQLGARKAADYIQVLENPARVAKLKVPEVIEKLRIREGMFLADIGAGSGIFTRPLGRAVGSEGKVFAVDVDQELLNYIASRSRDEGIVAVQTVLGEFSDPKIPQPVDVILMCDTLHHIEKRAEYVRTLGRYLKPGGLVAIIDFEKNWPAGHEAMAFTVQQVDQWMKDAGFDYRESHALIEDAFFRIYAVR